MRWQKQQKKKEKKKKKKKKKKMRKMKKKKKVPWRLTRVVFVNLEEIQVNISDNASGSGVFEEVDWDWDSREEG